MTHPMLHASCVNFLNLNLYTYNAIGSLMNGRPGGTKWDYVNPTTLFRRARDRSGI